MSTVTQFLEQVRPSAQRTAPGGGGAAWKAPRVNLLPAEFATRRAVGVAQRAAVAGLGASVLVVAAAWLVGGVGASSAQHELDAATARVSALQDAQLQYAAAPETIKALETAQGARATAMADDVDWSAYIRSLTDALPATSWTDGVQTALASSSDAAAPADALAPAGALGTVAVSARSTSYEDVAAYLEALASVPGVSDVYLTSSNVDESGSVPVVTFAVTAVITDEALTHRFDETTKEG